MYRLWLTFAQTATICLAIHASPEQVIELAQRFAEQVRPLIGH